MNTINTATAASLDSPIKAVERNPSALSADFQTFLVMLTTQLENQDPLNPLESTDFAVQLATFSGVEQQVRTNDLLRDLAGASSTSNIGSLAEWVGKEARIEGPVSFDGAPLTLAPMIAPTADSARLIVRNNAGQEVSSSDLSLSNDEIEWAGTDLEGRPLPVGTYTFEIENRSNGEVLSVSGAAHYALVREARMLNGMTHIVTANGDLVPTSEITGLKIPE